MYPMAAYLTKGGISRRGREGEPVRGSSSKETASPSSTSNVSGETVLVPGVILRIHDAQRGIMTPEKYKERLAWEARNSRYVFGSNFGNPNFK